MKKYILKGSRRKLFSILLLLIFVLSSTSCKKEEDINKGDLSSRIEKQQNEEEGVTYNKINKISKLDEGKEIVYDANYLDELQHYTAIDFEYNQEDELIEKEVEVNFDYCKIPYINLDSNGAKEINDQILDYTKEYIIGDYEYGKEEAIAYEPTASYTYEITDNYISIWFEYSISLFENPPNVRSFVLDLETGEELSLDKAIQISGVDKDIVGIVEGKIVEFHEDIIKDFKDSDYYEDTSFLNYMEGTLYNFWKEYYEGKLDFYLTPELELILLVDFEFPARGGIIQMELDIKPEDIPIEEEINPIYKYLAKDDYNSHGGGVAFLGYNSLDTMKTITSKVETIISKFGDQGKFPLSYFYHELDEGNYTVDGDEFYLLAAKYKNSVIKIYPPKYDENDEMIFDDDAAYIYGSNCILFCNFSDIRPNTKVEFIYRDKTIEFTPSLSLMDSSNINEIDGIIDLSDAYRGLEESEIYLELSSAIPYMWRLFNREGFMD